MEKYKVGKALEDAPDIKQPPHCKAGMVPKLHFRWILSGPSKSGKTNLARYAIDKFYTKKSGKSQFDRVVLISPTAEIDWTWQDLPGLKDKDRITHPTPSTLTSILQDQVKKISGGSSGKGSMKRLATKRHKADRLLVIFDDAIAESKLINSPEFLKLFIQGRHYNISSMVMTQSYMKVPRSVRLQATHVAMFPSKTTEIDRLYTEHGPRQLSKNEFFDMVSMATSPTEEEPFPFLYVDCFAPVNDRFRRNLTHKLQKKNAGRLGRGDDRGQDPSLDTNRYVGAGKKRNLDEYKEQEPKRRRR